MERNKFNKIEISKKIAKKILKQDEKKKKINEAKALVTKLGKKLYRHTYRNKDTNHINYKIQYLLHDPFTFINAYTKISKNKGTHTKEGHLDEGDVQLFGIRKANALAKKIKEGSYQFKPVKRTWIPKPGKKKKRPVDVSTQSDRIVQEAIRGILEAIYEPEFQEQGEKTKNLSNNYGFRPNKSTWSAIDKLKWHSKRCNYVIEGDIVSAYNNVNYQILISILRRRIKDKAFLNLVWKMLKLGIMNGKRYEHSLNGTPQGGIVSPLLFNIYMLELDRFVYEKFILPIELENEIKPKKNTGNSRAYNKIKYKFQKAKNELVKAKTDSTCTGNWYKTKNYKNAHKQFKKIQKEVLSTPYQNVSYARKGAVFVRYADDWVLAMTCTKKQALKAKETIAEFLNSKLKMCLNDEKTSVTHTTKGYKFLGFEIRQNTTKPKLMKVLVKKQKGGFTRALKRTTKRNLTIEPDSQRILKRLILLKFCRRDCVPIGKPIWRSYDEFQIVQKYAQIMRGIFNYYAPCGKFSRLYRISYILQYSCAKTIAGRKKISMPQVFKRYGLNLTVKKQFKTSKTEQTRVQRFYDIKVLRQMEKAKQEKGLNRSANEFDPFRLVEYWRTKFKVFGECCICGSIDNIELHHINSISSLKGKKDKAAAIRSQLNRLQIPVCKPCHNQITHGKYKNEKSPIDFYNEFLAKL